WIHVDVHGEVGVTERPPVGIDRCRKRFGELSAVREVSRHRVQIVDYYIDGRFRVKVAVVQFAVLDRQAVDAEGEELLHAVLPARVYARLACLGPRRLCEVELRPIQVDLTDERSMKQLSPLHRK